MFISHVVRLYTQLSSKVLIISLTPSNLCV